MMKQFDARWIVAVWLLLAIGFSTIVRADEDDNTTNLIVSQDEDIDRPIKKSTCYFRINELKDKLRQATVERDYSSNRVDSLREDIDELNEKLSTLTQQYNALKVIKNVE